MDKKEILQKLMMAQGCFYVDDFDGAEEHVLDVMDALTAEGIKPYN